MKNLAATWRSLYQLAVLTAAGVYPLPKEDNKNKRVLSQAERDQFIEDYARQLDKIDEISEIIVLGVPDETLANNILTATLPSVDGDKTFTAFTKTITAGAAETGDGIGAATLVKHMKQLRAVNKNPACENYTKFILAGRLPESTQDLGRGKLQ